VCVCMKNTFVQTRTLNVLDDRISHRLHLSVSDEARSEEEEDEVES
jgi:hypothetical protein